ncbi:hypothetical protein [Kistimonas asteriae]|uniref:hypothetical protein n=1 Tax=Kistimonas asteriae TaxID=517724 RepID=UPI001BA7030A|nr:hypothetical protein [Kistimonas asteriae]
MPRWVIQDALTSRASEIIMNTGFKMFPDSPAARGNKEADKGKNAAISSEQVAFAALLRGIYW